MSFVQNLLLLPYLKETKQRLKCVKITVNGHNLNFVYVGWLFQNSVYTQMDSFLMI